MNRQNQKLRDVREYLDKPVDGATVDQRRKHTTTGPEGVAHGTHTQHNVQLRPHTGDEILENLKDSHTHANILEHFPFGVFNP